MNILFYAEPVPIRNSFHQHSAVANIYSKIILDNFNWLVNSDFSVKILTNQHVRHEIIKNKPKSRPFLLTLDDKQEEILGSFLVDWQSQGLDVWQDLMLGRGNVSSSVEKILNKVRKSYVFDVVVCWGQNGALKKYCEKNGVQLLHMELSSIRPPFGSSMILDPRGVNGAASPIKLTLDDLKRHTNPVEPNFARLLLSYSQQNVADKVTAFDGVKNITLSEVMEITGRRALVPLQLFDDANILLYSPFNSPLDFLQKTIPQLTEAGYHVVVKCHPGAKSRPVNYLHQIECVDYCNTADNVTVIDRDVSAEENLSLIDWFDLVVTINSSVGFESALLGKIVCVLGESMYKVKDAFPSLVDALSPDFDYKVYRDNLRYIIGFFINQYFLTERYIYSEKFFDRVFYLTSNQTKTLSMDDFGLGECLNPYFDLGVE